jgi:phospholipid/cholesterol/gamma-HCH transport system permease protein
MTIDFTLFLCATAFSVAVVGSQGFRLPAIRASVVSFFEWFGELGQFIGRLSRAAIVPPYEFGEFFRQLDEMGFKSLPIAVLAGAATGAVLSMEMRDSLVRFGGKSLVPAIIVFSLIKETGPMITALVLAGRVGAGIGAELGAMKATEQIDALEASAVDPYKFLAATRVLACIVMLPLLTLITDFCGIMMGWVASTLAEPITLRVFLENGFKDVAFNDFIPPTLKTCVFGLIIGVISSFEGMRARGGTEGVGRAATSAVFLSSLFVILADVLLVRLILVWFT